MDPALSIEKVSLGLKSIFTDKRHLRGFNAEIHVRNYLEKFGFKILAQRLKTPFGEIDLLVRTNSESLYLIEVKAYSVDFNRPILRAKQKTRLMNCCLYLSEKYEMNVICKIALVYSDGQIVFGEEL